MNITQTTVLSDDLRCSNLRIALDCRLYLNGHNLHCSGIVDSRTVERIRLGRPDNG